MVGNLWGELVRRNRLLAWLGLAYFILFVALAGLSFFDAREIQGINRWIKPMKFAVSIGVYAWTLAWLLAYLKPQRARAVRGVSLLVAVTMLTEIFFIILQPARGTISHFNDATTFDKMIFALMGAAIAVNTLAVIWALVLFLRFPPQIPRSYLWGIRLGLLIFLLASAEGGFMAGRNSRYVPKEVTSVRAASPGLPFVNWSRREGDLRVAHFVGLHALQVVPLVGFLLHAYGRRRRFVRPVAWTISFAALYAAVAAGLFAQAMSGRPLLPSAHARAECDPTEFARRQGGSRCGRASV